MKDNFSTQAAAYARHRPTYPEALYELLYKHTPAFDYAWDCATGNGQVARRLAEQFRVVLATDISAAQIENAQPHDRIQYRVAPAEHSGLPDGACDLITAGQAAHWFDRPAFYTEAKRCLKPGGLLAIFGYKLPTIDPPTDELLLHLYDSVLGEYWDPERRFVDQGYAAFDFPFPEIAFPDLHMEVLWNASDLTGFLESWSATQHFIRREGKSPLNDDFRQSLAECWPEGVDKTVRFPMFGRAGNNPQS